ncbi:MAG: YceI family protein, partial [Trueperaceae bacterium]
TVRGSFEHVGGTIESADDGTPTAVHVEIDTASITTGTHDRDEHLRSADFFDAETNPKIVFTSDQVEDRGDGRYLLHGDLAMAGETRPVTLEAEIGESITDPWGMTRRAATASTKINRKEWGLTWNQVLEAGSLMVSEEVRISIDVQATLAG